MSLQTQTYDPAKFRVHVLADNCNDATAAIARGFGVTVHERNEPDLPGKGQVIAWALPKLLETEVDTFVFLDADSTVDPHFLSVVDAYLSAGSEAIQTSYRVADPDGSPLASLRALAFALMHELRGRGKGRVGVSVGIWGNGFVLSRRALMAQGWRSFSSVEDAEHHLDQVLAGRRVDFAPEASVYGDMPGNFRSARSQQVRWEAGRLSLLRRYATRLMYSAYIRRSPSAACALTELLLPPLSVLAVLELSALLLAFSFGGDAHLALALASLIGLAGYVLGGAVFARLRWRSYAGLMVYTLPYVVWKLTIYARELARRTDSPWTRTARNGRPVRN
jgi:cellulose synthase/poly-beta-1,6-N-acetylglucosamine synthase-like glycosyltransferase